MKITKFLSLVIVFFSVGCSSISKPIYTDSPSILETPEVLITSTSSPLFTYETPTQTSCFETAMTQFELNKCSGEQTQEVYAKLNLLITELEEHTNASHYATLLEIEENWEEVITEHCKWEAEYFSGGSIQPMWYSGCLRNQYLDRIDSLRINLCEGNGMTGECEESLKYKD